MSIVIPVYNGFSVTKRCIRSIYDMKTKTRFELIVIDNASSDGVTEWLVEEAGRRDGFRLVLNESNVGFARAINQGAALASGEAILICNSDVVLTDGSLDRLVAALDEDESLGLVSPVTNYVGEGPQIDPLASSVGPASAYWYASQLADAPIAPTPDRLVFFCVLVRRTIFEELGGLPEVYGLGNYEDDEFSVRVRLAGRRLGIHPGAFVYHQGSYSFHAPDISHQEWMTKNRRIFYDRLAVLSTTSGSPAFRPPEADVSVIVRTVDRPQLLRDAMQSLANQTVRPQVVLVNDGGPPVDDVIAGFADALEIVSVRHERSKGRGAALNAGVAAAGRRWVGFLDDDDILYPAHLELLLQGIEESGLPVSYGQVDKVLYRVRERENVPVARDGLGTFQFDPELLLASNRIPIHSFLAPRELVNEVGGFDEELQVLEDWEFLIRLSRRVPFSFVRRTTCEYRFLLGETLLNSVIASRAQALAAAEEIHRRYPIEDPALLERRKRVVDTMRDQVEKLREIQASTVEGEEQTFRILQLLNTFPSMKDATWSEIAALSAASTN